MGSVVMKNVPPYGLVYGNPAYLRGYVCKCGCKICSKEVKEEKILICSKCNCQYEFKQGFSGEFSLSVKT